MPTMTKKLLMSRRALALRGPALGLAALTPWKVLGIPTSTRRVVIRTDAKIGIVRPELHGQFAEHLGSCIYGALWVGKNSPIPNVEGYRQQAIEYLAELGVPVLRWPGGCFADDYHWRDRVGPMQKRPKRVNIHWGEYIEDNRFGTHEFIGLCRKIGLKPCPGSRTNAAPPSRPGHPFGCHPGRSEGSRHFLAQGRLGRDPSRAGPRWTGAGSPCHVAISEAEPLAS
jgi:alpha-N-arabinofuranosidase